MIINRISTNYDNYYSNKNYQTPAISPNFGYRVVMEKPKIDNVLGKQMYEKALKLAAILPDGAKMKKPSCVAVLNGGMEETYGVVIDKTNKDSLRMIFKNITNKKDWEKIESREDVFEAVFDKEAGKMQEGNYNGMHFYRNSKNRNRRILTEEGRFAPVTRFYPEKWGLTTYGRHNVVLDEKIRHENPLSSVFWALTDQNASILK